MKQEQALYDVPSLKGVKAQQGFPELFPPDH